LGNVINLNKYRKQKAKADRDKQAEVNRRLHGRTKLERTREELQKQQLTRSVEGARLVGPAPEGPSASGGAEGAEGAERADEPEPA
jgi:hypothetical protein